MEPRLRKTPGRTYYESSIEDFISLKHPNDIITFLTESDETTDEYEVAKYYDSTYEYLKSCGIKDINETSKCLKIKSAVTLPF